MINETAYVKLLGNMVQRNILKCGLARFCHQFILCCQYADIRLYCHPMMALYVCILYTNIHYSQCSFSVLLR